MVWSERRGESGERQAKEWERTVDFNCRGNRVEEEQKTLNARVIKRVGENRRLQLLG